MTICNKLTIEDNTLKLLKNNLDSTLVNQLNALGYYKIGTDGSGQTNPLDNNNNNNSGTDDPKDTDDIVLESKSINSTNISFPSDEYDPCIPSWKLPSGKKKGCSCPLKPIIVPLGPKITDDRPIRFLDLCYGSGVGVVIIVDFFRLIEFNFPARKDDLVLVNGSKGWEIGKIKQGCGQVVNMWFNFPLIVLPWNPNISTNYTNEENVQQGNGNPPGKENLEENPSGKETINEVIDEIKKTSLSKKVFNPKNSFSNKNPSILCLSSNIPDFIKAPNINNEMSREWFTKTTRNKKVFEKTNYGTGNEKTFEEINKGLGKEEMNYVTGNQRTATEFIKNTGYIGCLNMSIDIDLQLPLLDDLQDFFGSIDDMINAFNAGINNLISSFVGKLEDLLQLPFKCLTEDIQEKIKELIAGFKGLSVNLPGVPDVIGEFLEKLQNLIAKLNALLCLDLKSLLGLGGGPNIDFNSIRDMILGKLRGLINKMMDFVLNNPQQFINGMLGILEDLLSLPNFELLPALNFMVDVGISLGPFKDSLGNIIDMLGKTNIPNIMKPGSYNASLLNCIEFDLFFNCLLLSLTNDLNNLINGFTNAMNVELDNLLKDLDVGLDANINTPNVSFNGPQFNLPHFDFDLNLDLNLPDFEFGFDVCETLLGNFNDFFKYKLENDDDLLSFSAVDNSNYVFGYKKDDLFSSNGDMFAGIELDKDISFGEVGDGFNEFFDRNDSLTEIFSETSDRLNEINSMRLGGFFGMNMEIPTLKKNPKLPKKLEFERLENKYKKESYDNRNAGVYVVNNLENNFGMIGSSTEGSAIGEGGNGESLFDLKQSISLETPELSEHLKNITNSLNNVSDNINSNFGNITDTINSIDVPWEMKEFGLDDLLPNQFSNGSLSSGCIFDLSALKNLLNPFEDFLENLSLDFLDFSSMENALEQLQAIGNFPFEILDNMEDIIANIIKKLGELKGMFSKKKTNSKTPVNNQPYATEKTSYWESKSYKGKMLASTVQTTFGC